MTRFAFVGKEVAKDSDLWRYEARLRPWLWYLTRELGLQDLAEQDRAADSRRRVRQVSLSRRRRSCEGSYKEWEYCVQYQETDFNFVSRLMEHEGIYYYFQHEMGRHTLVLADAFGAHSAVPGYASIPYHSAGPRRRC